MKTRTWLRCGSGRCLPSSAPWIEWGAGVAKLALRRQTRLAKQRSLARAVWARMPCRGAFPSSSGAADTQMDGQALQR